MEIAERPDTAKPIIAHPQAKIHSTASQSKGDSAEMIAFAIELPMTAIALSPYQTMRSQGEPINPL